jgi:subtilisin
MAPIPELPPTGKSAQLVTVRVTEKKEGKTESVGSGLVVTALSNLQKKIGDNKVTDSEGKVIVRVSGDTIKRLYCEKMWAWGAFYRDVTANPIIDLGLETLSENFKDCVRTYYTPKRFDITTGVTVGVIDTGVGPHDDLNVIGGYNSVEGEPHNDYLDAGPHGTFVAGLIGSKGKLFPQLRGLAPGVKIRSYRVFGGGLAGGETDALIDALYHAELDKCDILNLSIESPEEGPGLKNEALQAAMSRARDNGMLVVVAAGNDGKDVDYPAAYDEATAVSAMGCKGTFPEHAMENMVISDVTARTDPNEFIASFSNRGKQISVTALGVGVVSTLPGNSFGSCSGTSFAAPVVTGVAASLLSQHPEIYGKDRTRERSNAIEQLLLSSCILRGFDPQCEGHGMPNPDMV